MKKCVLRIAVLVALVFSTVASGLGWKTVDAASCDTSGPAVDLTLELQTADTGISTDDALATDVNVINRRLGGLGSMANVQPIPDHAQIQVLLPATSDVNNVVRVIQQTALFEIIDPEGQYLPPGTVVTTSLGGSVMPDDAAATPGPIYTTIVSGVDLKDAYPTTNSLGQSVVGFELNDSASDTFFKFTSANLGKYMSLVIDKVVISSPTINGAISNQGIIEVMPVKDVNNLVIQLKSGALAAPLKVVRSRSVPSMCSASAVDPQTLFNLLANTLIDSDELPAGFGAATVSPAPADVVQNFTNGGIANLVGVVGVKIDDNTIFYYLVFADDASAQTGMATYGNYLLRQGMQSASANGAIDQPWACYAADASGQSIGLCMEQSANVLVVGLSAVPSNPNQAMANATDLTTAGVTHLKRLVSSTS